MMEVATSGPGGGEEGGGGGGGGGGTAGLFASASMSEGYVHQAILVLCCCAT